MNKPRVNDFFCGAGGMGLGFKFAGFEIAGAWDFDKYAVQSYAHNVGDHVKQADITEMKYTDIPAADVWTFGFPCQDLSVSGKKAGLHDGKRSKLFFEVMRLIDEIKEFSPENLPEILMAENVKGLRQYLPVLKEEYNKRGYRMTYALYNSKYWGVPQNRERFFVVGIREDVKKAFQFPRQQTEYVPKLSGILEFEADEKYYMTPEKTRRILQSAEEVLPLMETADCFAIRGRYNSAGKTEQQIEFRKDSVTNTLTGVQKDNMVAYLSRGRVRKLTPREYARLQGFPDDYEQIVSNNQFYKQMGNAVTVNVAQAIAEHLAAFIERKPYPQKEEMPSFQLAAEKS